MIQQHCETWTPARGLCFAAAGLAETASLTTLTCRLGMRAQQCAGHWTGAVLQTGVSYTMPGVNSKMSSCMHAYLLS